VIACFLSNISAKYYENPTMLSRVIAKNVGMFFFETLYIIIYSFVETKAVTKFTCIENDKSSSTSSSPFDGIMISFDLRMCRELCKN